MPSEEVKIYVRNSKKYGKILNIPPTIQASQLYRLAAASQNLQVQDVRLILGGQVVGNDSGEVILKEKAIVHLINLAEVNRQNIDVHVKMLHSRSGATRIETPSDTTIRDFIDDKLYKAYGEKSDVLLLVHIGRQLNLDRTFRQELIEDNSELIVANIQELKNRKNAQPPKQIESAQQIAVPIRDLEVPQEPKDIYPQPNFTINVPQEVNASMNMDLIFDSKIRHASSLQRVELQPEEIIPEQVVPKISEEAQEEENEAEGKTQENEEKIEEKGTEEELVGLKSAKPVTSTEVIAQQEVVSAPAEQFVEAVQGAPQETEVKAEIEEPQSTENRNLNEENEEVSSELRRPEEEGQSF